MPEFIPGLKLGELFFQEAVKPILDADFPNLSYSAALIGSGSEILGYDTPQSTDHHWGPRLMIFLPEDYFSELREAIHESLANKLPYTFRGYSTNFGPAEDESGSRLLKEIHSGLIQHRVELYTIKGYFNSYLGFDPRGEIQLLDWLTCSEQRLLTMTAGKVYHDATGELVLIREKLKYYPHDVWLYILASQWERISEEEAFVGRCGDVGDDLGSRLVAARLVRDLMKLCFLMEKTYAPYSKWFGTAFAQLPIAGELASIFHHVLAAGTWKKRESFLSQAYEIVVQRHNELGITESQSAQVSPFYGRPYLVIHADQFAGAVRNAIQDEEIKRLQVRIGAVDQFVDCTDILSNAKLLRRLGALFEE